MALLLFVFLRLGNKVTEIPRYLYMCARMHSWPAGVTCYSLAFLYLKSTFYRR